MSTEKVYFVSSSKEWRDMMNRKISKYAHIMMVLLMGIFLVGICGNSAKAANIAAVCQRIVGLEPASMPSAD